MSAFLKMPSAIAIASLFSLSLAGPVVAEGTKQTGAQNTQTTPSTKQASATERQPAAARQVRASQFIGKDVRNAQGEARSTTL